ncbi:MAG: FkbM family methyltransferase [Patescibacteria group bacterium]
MLNLKKSKIYKVLKLISFSFLYYILKTLSINNRLFYLSKWVRDNGDDRLLVNYPINSKGTILDVGGYTGVFSDKLLAINDVNLIIFEPVQKYYKILKKKYTKNRKVKIYNLGLSDQNYSDSISVSNDSTSLFKNTGKTEKANFIDVGLFVKKVKKIDLMSINIEGSEYQVLDRLIKTNQIKKIKYVQIQFHDFVPNAKIMRRALIKKILKTHKIRYSYPFVWESFELIN